MAIDNENLEMVELLLEFRVETKDALLHAISEEYVEAVEVLLDHEELIHKEGEPHVSCDLITFHVVVNSKSREARNEHINALYSLEMLNLMLLFRAGKLFRQRLPPSRRT